MGMEQAIAIRDTAFWWLGVYALITGANAMFIFPALRRWRLENREKPVLYDQDTESDTRKDDDNGEKG